MSAIIQIDRGNVFDSVAFLGKGLSIQEQDERSLQLNEVDLNRIHFVTTLKDDEKTVVGEERLIRLIASGLIRLDARVFYALWKNKTLIPKSWRTKDAIFFDGTIFFSRCVLYLSWDMGEWRWDYCRLMNRWDANSPSICLTSQKVSGLLSLKHEE